MISMSSMNTILSSMIINVSSMDTIMSSIIINVSSIIICMISSTIVNEQCNHQYE